MFVSQSDIEVTEAATAALEAAFKARARLVDKHQGFLGLELLRDVTRAGRYVLITRWKSRDDFRVYLKSQDFKAAHARQHDGIDDAGGGSPLRQFQSVELGSE